MNWPKPPFPLNKNKKKDGDSFLIKYLQGGRFTYLSKISRGIIAKLKPTARKNDLRYFHEELIKLWPLVLTDALKELKRHDEREYGGKNRRKMDTFFDPASLGTTDLKEVLKGFSEFEGMMYGASPSHYRDHIEHSFRVWIIGHGILQTCFGGTLLAPAKDIGLSNSITQVEWECMWAIVALCHDIGYPLSHIERINERARETLQKQGLISEGDLRFTFRQQMLPFHDTLIKIMSSEPIRLPGREPVYHTHVQNKYYLKFLKSFDKLDHGIVSALMVSKSLTYFLESDFSQDTLKPLNENDSRQFLIRREILRSIAAHTCQDIYHLDFNTLAFLLYVVDEIQCWGRPTLEELQHEATNIGEGYAEIKSLSKKKMNIQITTGDSEWNESQQRGVLYEVLKLRRMLRLALDITKLVNKKLIFEVRNKKGKQRLRLMLRNGAIELRHKKFQTKGVIDSVPMLRQQIKKIK